MAKEQFMTKKLTGYFDVREYKEGKSREQRRMLSNTETIVFNASFNADDAELQQFLEFAKPVDKNGVTIYYVSFKINYKCNWFDEYAQPIERPDSSYLENKPFEVIIRYAVVVPQGVFVPTPQNPIDKRARGYWANAIQFREAQTNPFVTMSGAAPVPPMPGAAPIPPMPQQQAQPVQPQQYQQSQQMSAPMPPMFGNENENDNLPY